MKRLLGRHAAARLLLRCYALGCLVLLFFHLGGFLYNRVLHLAGRLEARQLTIEDFDLHDLAPLDVEAYLAGQEEPLAHPLRGVLEGDAVYVTTGADPQMRLKDDTLLADGVALHMDVLGQDGFGALMATAYYGRPGQDASPARMAYARVGEGFRMQSPLVSSLPTGPVYYTLDLPAWGGQSLRIDPEIAEGRIIVFHAVTLNPPRGFFSFLAPTAGEVWALLLVPGFVAAGLGLLPGGWRRKVVRAHG